MSIEIKIRRYWYWVDLRTSGNVLYIPSYQNNVAKKAIVTEIIDVEKGGILLAGWIGYS